MKDGWTDSWMSPMYWMMMGVQAGEELIEGVAHEKRAIGCFLYASSSDPKRDQLMKDLGGKFLH